MFYTPLTEVNLNLILNFTSIFNFINPITLIITEIIKTLLYLKFLLTLLFILLIY